MSVTEWEWWHLIYSQALEPASRQQGGHYSWAAAGFVRPRGSASGGREESAGVLGSAGGDGDVSEHIRGVCCSGGSRSHVQN